MVHLGHYIERTVQEILHQRNSPNFNSMIFHHTITLSLIIFSYQLKYLIFGIPIILQHSITDIFVNLCRLVREIKIKQIYVIITYTCLIILWSVMRILSYISEILTPLINFIIFKKCEGNVLNFLRTFNISHYFFAVTLFSLLILNVNWCFQIYISGYYKFI